MQRLFSAFPGGWPGAGLLLLRAVLGLTVAAQGAFYFSSDGSLTPGAVALGSLLLLTGTGLLIGLFTPALAMLAAVITFGTVSSWVLSPATTLIDSKLVAILLGAVALSLIFIGPGALSLDASFFGRREIIIPPSSPSQRSSD